MTIKSSINFDFRFSYLCHDMIILSIIKLIYSFYPKLFLIIMIKTGVKLLTVKKYIILY